MDNGGIVWSASRMTSAYRETFDSESYRRGLGYRRIRRVAARAVDILDCFPESTWTAWSYKTPDGAQLLSGTDDAAILLTVADGSVTLLVSGRTAQLADEVLERSGNAPTRR